MEKKIVGVQTFTEGKKGNQRENQDSMYVGENFVAVIDGVSRKSSVKAKIKRNGKEEEIEIKIADIIAEAIGVLDSEGSKKTFEEVVEFINSYIKEYLQRVGMDSEVGELEATAAIYSKHHNQVWIIGDCGVICDGVSHGNPLKIDEVYREIRNKIIEELLKEGYREEDLIKKDIARDILSQKTPEEELKLLSRYVKSGDARERIVQFRTQKIREALQDCGYSEEEITKKDLIETYYNPRALQQKLKNNPNMGKYGYAVLNGENTELRNCKIVDIPEDAENIILHTDGFAANAFKANDIRSAVKEMRERAQKDPLSKNENPSTHAAVATIGTTEFRQKLPLPAKAKRFKEALSVTGRKDARDAKKSLLETRILRIDDLTAVKFRLVRAIDKNPVVNSGDGR